FDSVFARIQLEDNVFSNEMEDVEYHPSSFLDAFHEKLVIGDAPLYWFERRYIRDGNVRFDQEPKNELKEYFICNLIYLEKCFSSDVYDNEEEAREDSAYKCIYYLTVTRQYDVELVKELVFKTNPKLSQLFDLHEIKVENFNLSD